MPRARKPSARRRRSRARRPSPWRMGLPVLEQHHYDLLGLALVCVGVFLAFPLYLDWDGGRMGEWMVRGTRYVVGEGAYVAPLGLVAAGAVLVLRPVLPAARPFRSGAVCLVGAITLAFAAGTFGLGPGAATAHWRSELFEHRGGIVGDALYYGSSTAFGSAGAHLIAVFLFLAGLLLVTGASIAGVLRATGTGMAETTRVVRRGSEELAALGQRIPRRAPVAPPEPEYEDLVVTRTVAPPVIEEPLPEPVVEQPVVPEMEADLEEEEPAPQPDPEPPPLADGEEVEWEIPEPRAVLRFSTEDGLKPDTRGQEQTAARLIEALGHFGVNAQVIGAVTGPHITRYELRLAPGTKMSKVAQLKDDLAYALAAT